MREAMKKIRWSIPVSAVLVALLLAACSKDTTPAPEGSTTASAPATTTSASGCSTTEPSIPAKTQMAKPFPMTINPKHAYTATMDTSCGEIVIQLTPEKTPETVNNFVALADEGWYDGTLIHRISSGIAIIQGGDPLCVDQPEACGSGGPGYAIKDELSGKEKYVEGVLAMANAGPDTGGSQFFIVTGPEGAVLQPDYAIFGNVTEGLDVAQTIQQQPVGGATGETPLNKIWINTVTIDESP